MKVFISWSGERGKAVAKGLAQWLPKLFEGLEVFYSGRDIAAGDAWLLRLFEELRDSSFGVLCLTPENRASPWLQFEAGAVWRGLKGARIVPYCHDLIPDDVGEPLKHLQGVANDAEGTWRLVQSLNECRDKPRGENELKDVFDALWPKLQKALAKVQLPPEQAGQKGGLCSRITGTWWERIRPDDSSALSFVTIEPDAATGTVRLGGRAYNRQGRKIANWGSVAACIDESRNKVFYYWTGHIITTTGAEEYAGFAELNFEAGGGAWSRASGFFSDTNLRDMKRTTRKSVELYRSDADDVRIMGGSSASAIGKLIRARLDSLG